ncbi:possible transcriptional regulator, MarR family [Leptospira ryugenii]|uniref:Possible transcriptional regulator, MarR family n=1 Tax=Leptospira ryugenii TaxID=1917863 RepID=A0A2P2DXR7_9LEPT|nr:possible transcriptional regulator, MarR family [Leptospira ryugenii]
MNDLYKFPYLSSEPTFLVWRLGKFIRLLVKPVLSSNGLFGVDDFAILSHIDYLKSCSKMEAIETNIIDNSTGIEIIKRLIQQKLIIEKDNP